MWPVLAVAIGVVGWRVARGMIKTSSSGQGPSSGPESAGGLSCATDLSRQIPDFEVAWAYVPFDTDPSMGKERPVIVLDSDSDTITVLELRSGRGPTTETMTWVPVGQESARTFDHKQQAGWVKVARPRVLPIANLASDRRPRGRLAADDARGVWGAMLEYVL
jgi:hypothetical protein